MDEFFTQHLSYVCQQENPICNKQSLIFLCLVFNWLGGIFCILLDAFEK